MSNLKSLTFTTTPKRDASPLQFRRVRMVERLEEQKRLVSDQRWLGLFEQLAVGS